VQTTEESSTNAATAQRHVRVLQVLPSLIYGGTEFYVLGQLRKTNRAAFSQTVCYLVPKAPLLESFQAAGIRTVCLHHGGPLTAVRTIFRLTRLIRELDIDVVQTHSRFDRFYGQMAAMIAGVPVVNTMHSMYVAERYRSSREASTGFGAAALRLRIEDWLERRTVRHVVAVSDEVKRAWSEHAASARVAGGHITVANAGVDFDRFDLPRTDPRIASVRQSLGLQDAFPVLVNVARLQQVKAQRMLVPVMSALVARWPAARAVIVGEGPERAALESAIRDAGLEGRIVLAGARTDIPEVLASADVFVFPSQSEGFGIAVLEAVAAAKPVVAFDLPPLVDMLGPLGSAVLVGSRSEADLANAVVAVVEQLDAWQRRACTARDAARDVYGADAWAAKLERIYREVIS
jgi:glycosyltransferase involved in cell wall biosynthesis